MNHLAVLFDLDGTLLDTLKDIADSINQALGDFSFPPHELETYRGFVGVLSFGTINLHIHRLRCR